MRKESLLFVGTLLVTMLIFGIHATIGLALFGASWLVFGKG